MVIECGFRAGHMLNTVEIGVAASQTFSEAGGKFVKISTNVTLADSGDTELFGWANTGGGFTSSATAGASKVTVNVALDAIYEIPTDATQTEAQLKALMGKTCDLIVNSSVQYADIGESSEDVIQIVGWRYYGSGSGQQTVLVRLNPVKLGATGVV